MKTQNQSTQQDNRQQQQQCGIFGSHPGLTYDHGSELPQNDFEDLTPPAQDFFPGHHSGAV